MHGLLFLTVGAILITLAGFIDTNSCRIFSTDLDLVSFYLRYVL